jgi:hypothetical protein
MFDPNARPIQGNLMNQFNEVADDDVTDNDMTGGSIMRNSRMLFHSHR